MVTEFLEAVDVSNVQTLHISDSAIASEVGELFGSTTDLEELTVGGFTVEGLLEIKIPSIFPTLRVLELHETSFGGADVDDLREMLLEHEERNGKLEVIRISVPWGLPEDDVILLSTWVLQITSRPG